MKKLIAIVTFGILVLLTLYGYAFAKVFIVVNTDTKEVLSISDLDDAVIPPGPYEKVILDKDIRELELEYNPDYYKLIGNNKLIENTKKISDEENRKAEDREVLAELKIVRDKMKDMAIAQLESEGKIIKHKDKIKEAK